MAQEFWPLARRDEGESPSTLRLRLDEGESQGARGITNAAKRPKEQARLLPLFVYSDLPPEWGVQFQCRQRVAVSSARHAHCRNTPPLATLAAPDKGDRPFCRCALWKSVKVHPSLPGMGVVRSAMVRRSSREKASGLAGICPNQP